MVRGDASLVDSSEDARRFHLWEATPLEYLERLHLQNQLVPSLNALVGIVVQSDGDLAIVSSQPAFDVNPVPNDEIEAWFAARGFERIAPAAYYRREDNLGIFDAHDKNVVRPTANPDLLIPFDVIPCHPDGGFLQYIEDTLAAGHTLHTVRSTHTS